MKTRDHPFTDTWAAMEKIYEGSNKVRAIGVSNFSVKKYVGLTSSPRKIFTV